MSKIINKWDVGFVAKSCYILDKAVFEIVK